MNTTETVNKRDIYKLKREPSEAARDIDKLDLTVKTVGGNMHEVAGETFETIELAGEYVRKLRYIASQFKLCQEPEKEARRDL